jgi:hypothetical protein
MKVIKKTVTRGVTETVRKGKAKEGSSSQSESSATVGCMMSALMRLITSFAKVQLWKHWNKLKNCSTANMDDEELKIHRETIKDEDDE